MDCEGGRSDSPDRVTGERHSEGLEAVEQLFFCDARTQLMDIFLGWKRELMLAVSESTLKIKEQKDNYYLIIKQWDSNT